MGRRASSYFVGLAALIFSFDAHAVALTSLNAANDDTVGSTRTIYYPVQGSVSPGTQHVFPGSLSILDGRSASSLLIFQIQATKNLGLINGQAEGTAVDPNAISIKVAPLINLSNELELEDFDNGYNGTTTQVKFGNVQTATRQFGVRLGGTNGLCQAYGPIASSDCGYGINAVPPVLTFRIGLIKTGQAFDINNTAGADYFDVRVVMVDAPTHNIGSYATPTINFGLIRGDQRVKIANVSAAPVANDTSVVPLNSVVVYGTKTGTAPTIDNSDIQREFKGKQGGGTYTVDGLTNEILYCFALGYVNKGGMVTTDGSWGTSFAGFDANNHCVTPSQIDGFLKENSTCLITTAAYGNGWDGKLKVLRQFRDQILNQFDAGKSFTQWYYSWSPAAAHWLIENPAYRGFVRVMLFPLVESARAMLWLRQNMWMLGVMFVLGSLSLVVRNLKQESEA